MSNNIRELNEAELEVVAGGMSCKTALAVSRIWLTAGDILKACGDQVQAAAAYGRADGVVTGACPH